MSENWKAELFRQFANDTYSQKDFLNKFEHCLPGTCRDSKRRRLKNYISKHYTELNTKNLNAVEDNKATIPANQSCSFSNGTYIYDKTIEVAAGTPITEEIIMAAHNLDPDKWEVVSFKSNFWQSQAKDNNVIELYQSKVTVKPKVIDSMSFDIIDNYFNNKNWNIPAFNIVPFKYNESDEYLDINFCDSHLGLLSWRNETGTDYDLHIASERFIQVFLDIVKRCKYRKFKSINFATLGDILHIDNYKNETAKGTRQDVDGRLSKIFDIGVDTIIQCINTLLELECPISYTYTCGNHDTFSGYALAKCVEKAFYNNPNVTFDISPMPQKVKQYGNMLVGYCHGDMVSKNLGEWLQKKYRKQFGECKFAEVHCGHLHSEAVKENCGVLIKHLPSICESSYWECSEGYSSDKGLMAFVYNENTGLRETWYTYL